MILRPYQLDALQRMRERFRAGAQAVLLVAPTGAGKTVIMRAIVDSHLSRRPDGAPLVLVHRTDLREQTEDRVPGARVETVQSLLRTSPMPSASLVVLDEAHHYAADEWGEVASTYAGVPMVGLTATPQRSDGRGLGDLFDSLVVVASVSELTAQGYLVPARVYAPAEKQQGIVDPIAAYREHGRGRRTIVFAAHTEHAKQITESLVRLGVSVGRVDSTVPAADRAAAVSEFRAGGLDALANVFCLTEGFDAPEASCCIIARGCSSQAAWLQMIGRVLRPAPGKSEAVVVDCGGAVHAHGLPEQDREYTLDSSGIHLRKDPMIQMRQCPQCGAMGLLGSECKACGYPFPPPKDPKLVRAALERVRAGHSVDQRQAAWERLRDEGRAKGWKRGAAMHRYKARYGQWPDRSWG